MTTVYVEEINSDDEVDTEHNGEPVEHLAPIELPVHTLTAPDVAAYQAASKENHAALAASELPAANDMDATSIRLRGNAAFSEKRFEDAIKLYTAAIALDPENGSLYGNRSATHLQLGRTQPAVSDARQMVSLMPTTAKAQFRLGSALSAAGNPAEAAEAFSAGLNIDPTSQAIADALRKELSRPALKKGRQHAQLVQECHAMLNAVKISESMSPAEDMPPMSRLSWVEHKLGVLPPKRGGATLTAAAGRLWLIGGADRSGAVHADVWELNVSAKGTDAVSAVASHGQSSMAESYKWRKHELACQMRARSGHSTVSLNGAGCAAALMLFGGHDPASSMQHNDLNILHVPSEPGKDAQWTREVATNGSTPEARNGHTLSLMDNGHTAILFGGADNDSHRSDVWRLEVHSVRHLVGDRSEAASEHAAPLWEEMACKGQPPAPREMHISAIIPGRNKVG